MEVSPTSDMGVILVGDGHVAGLCVKVREVDDVCCNDSPNIFTLGEVGSVVGSIALDIVDETFSRVVVKGFNILILID